MNDTVCGCAIDHKRRCGADGDQCDRCGRIDMLRAENALLRARVAELEPMAECAAIMAVCGYFSRMRGPDAWQLHIEDRRFLWTEDPTSSLPNATPLYAGSAPVPAAQAVDVDAICNAYESGVGHRGRPTANVNPYREGTPEHEAYAIGAKGEAAQAEANDASHALNLFIALKYAVKQVPELASVPGIRDALAEYEPVIAAMLAAKAKGG